MRCDALHRPTVAACPSSDRCCGPIHNGIHTRVSGQCSILADRCGTIAYSSGILTHLVHEDADDVAVLVHHVLVRTVPNQQSTVSERLPHQLAALVVSHAKLQRAACSGAALHAARCRCGLLHATCNPQRCMHAACSVACMQRAALHACCTCVPMVLCTTACCDWHADVHVVRPEDDVVHAVVLVRHL